MCSYQPIARVFAALSFASCAAKRHFLFVDVEKYRRCSQHKRQRFYCFVSSRSPKTEKGYSETRQTKSTRDRKKVLSQTRQGPQQGVERDPVVTRIGCPNDHAVESGIQTQFEPVDRPPTTTHTDAPRQTDGFELWPVDNRFAFDAQDHSQNLVAGRSCFRNKLRG
jgi:hypothetical protein